MPYENFQFHLAAESLNSISQNVGIDFGEDFIKVSSLLRNKSEINVDDSQNNGEVVINLLQFKREDIKEALEYASEKRNELQTDSAVSNSQIVTGRVSESDRHIVRALLGVDVEFKSHIQTEIDGSHFLLKEIPYMDLLHKDVATDVKSSVIEFNELHSEVIASMRREVNSDRNSDIIFPCLVVNLDEWPAVIRLDSDGSSKVISSLSMGAPTFRHLSHLLLHTQNYDEVSALAEKGSRNKCDTLAMEMIENGGMEYGRLDPELPFFPFGKLADYQHLTLESLEREDIARSLIGMLASSWYFELMTAALGERVPLVFIGGNMVRSKLIREEVKKTSTLWGVSLLQIKFSQVGTYAASIGCMMKS